MTEMTEKEYREILREAGLSPEPEGPPDRFMSAAAVKEAISRLKRVHDPISSPRDKLVEKLDD